jgi:predicted SAM-dependent methyltransferase
MLSWSVKRTYFAAMRYPMLVNGWLYRHLRAERAGARVHLGPGQRNYVDGWINVDANFLTAKVDVWADVSTHLPFPDASVDVFYSHHVIEHLHDWHLPQHFASMHRALRRGGGIRIGAPHLGNACRKYVEGDAGWFGDFPDLRSSVGGRFTNFVFCHGEHLTALDDTYLAELASNAGFRDVRFCAPTKETNLRDVGVDERILATEHESDWACPHTIILEARKP